MEKQKRKNILLAVILTAVMLASVVSYSRYIQRQIYHESTQNLFSTYGQVTKTFNMFAQRNWNILEIWSEDLVQLAEGENVETKWRQYVQEKANWQYSEVVFFNEKNQFWTVGGRQGDVPHMQSVLKEVYATDDPIVTSYISSQDVRKVMFAQQVEPVTMDGVTYTSLAICYDNTTLENMLGGMAYEGQSDCYIVRSNGDVVLSTEPKSEITDRLSNLFDYLKTNAVVSQPYFDEMLQNIPQQRAGSLSYSFKLKNYYLVYQPVGVKDWAIIGIVPADVVDSGMRDVQTNTMLMITVLAGVILVGIGKIFRDGAKARREKMEREKQELERRKELSDQMFQGMARIVDRFAVCDIDKDWYEYHERRGRELYPAEGYYSALLAQMSQQYMILTDGEKVKLDQMLAPDNLRCLIRKKEDSIKIEYAARDKSEFQMMTVVPTGWEDGRLTQVMMIAQDMGEQHVLRAMANTDSLTGLLNKRYFSTLQEALIKRGQAFALFYLDLDYFKPVNDTYGHDVGDKLLQQVAKRLRSCIRTADYAFRLGGDEFALLVVGDLNKDVCLRKAAAIKSTVGAPYEVDGKTLTIGISCGYALYPEESPDAEQACKLADLRMYTDKQKNHALLEHGLRA